MEMDKFRSVDDILDFAMKQEQIAAGLYRNMAVQSTSPATKQLFVELEKELNCQIVEL